MIAIATVGGRAARLAALLMVLLPALATAAPASVIGMDALISFDTDALHAAGLETAVMHDARHHVAAVPGRVHEAASFAATGSGRLELLREGSVIHGLGGGAIAHRGGPVLVHDDGTIDLSGFLIQPDPDAPLALLLADAQGTVWFSADHAHYGYAADDAQTLELRHMNLRISAHLAGVLGDARLFGEPIGALDFRGRIDAPPARQAGTGQCTAPWPRAGLLTDVAMIHSDLSGWHDGVYARRCSLPPLPDGGACTPTSTTGQVVITPDSSLRNIGETGIAWYSHFQGRFAPYDNDQHPILIWNLYRIDADGGIHQIGASGAKHAFYTVNARCGCAAGHVVFPGCEDTYSLASNDNNAGPEGQVWQNLAPRAEIIPYSVQWARCGSAWDPECRGQMAPGSGAQDLYDYRLLATEAQMMSPLADGARFFLEYWYLVRDDADIYNTMGHREIRPYKTTTAGRTTWRIDLPDAHTPERGFTPGPVLNRWVDPRGDAANVEWRTSRGRVRVAVRVTALGNSRWHYRYALMNFDYANARTDPHSHEPDLRLLSSRGIAGFGVHMPENAWVGQPGFATLRESLTWPVRREAVELQWRADDSADTLDWGMLNQFEFISDAPPSAQGMVVLHDHAADGGGQHRLSMLGPRLPAAARTRDRPIRILPWPRER